MEYLEEKVYKIYLIKLLFAIFMLLSIVAFINYFFDPYGIYNNRFIIKNLNDRKPMINSHTRIHKTQKVFLNNYDCIFLGTSRVEASFVFKNNDYINKFCKTYYNAALSSSNVVEMYYMLSLVIKYSNPKKIFYGLDFLQFNAKGFRSQELHREYFLKPLYTRIIHLFSYDMIKDIIRTFNTKESSFYDEFGSWNIENEYRSKFPTIDLNTIFLINEKAFYHNFYKEFDYQANGINTWEYYQKIFELVKKNKQIDFYIYINPFHVRLLEVMDMRIGYKKFEDWKKELVYIHNQNQIPIYDFSGYNFITMEKIDPSIKESQYFYDSSHIKKIVGKIILDYILNKNKRSDFGISLDTENIESYLKEQRLMQKHWRQRNQILIKQIHDFINSKF